MEGRSGCTEFPCTWKPHHPIRWPGGTAPHKKPTGEEFFVPSPPLVWAECIFAGPATGISDIRTGWANCAQQVSEPTCPKRSTGWSHVLHFKNRQGWMHPPSKQGGGCIPVKQRGRWTTGKRRACNLFRNLCFQKLLVFTCDHGDHVHQHCAEVDQEAVSPSINSPRAWWVMSAHVQQ